MEFTLVEFTNLCQELGWKDYQELFRNFGQISKLYIDPEVTYGSVRFVNAEDALAAKRELDGQPPLNLSVTITPPRGTGAHNSSASANNTSHSNKTSNMYNRRSYYKPHDDPDVYDVSFPEIVYVDVYGRVLDTLMAENGEIFISLTDLRKSGFDAFPGDAQLPKFGESVPYDQKLLQHHELYLQAKSKEFMIAAGQDYPQDALNKMIAKIQQEFSTTMENGARSTGGNQSYSQNRNYNRNKSRERTSYPTQEVRDNSTRTNPNNWNENRSSRYDSSRGGGNFRGRRSNNNDSRPQGRPSSSWNKPSSSNRNENNTSMKTERNAAGCSTPLQYERMDVNIPQKEEDGTHVVRVQKSSPRNASTPQHDRVSVNKNLEYDSATSSVPSPILRRPMAEETKTEAISSTSKKTVTIISNDVDTPKPLRPLVIETIANSGIFDYTDKVNDDTFVGVAMPETFVEELNMLDEITNDCKPDPSFKPNLGDTVAVSKDGTYVRGIVINNLNGKYACALIDYGVVTAGAQICPLPDKYLAIPEFACVCKANSATIVELSKGSEHPMAIETPSRIKVTIEDSGKVVEVTACRWDPFETSPLAIKKNKPVTNMQQNDTTNTPILRRPTMTEEAKTEVKPNTPKEIITNDLGTAKPLRPIVIETIAKSGFFDCTEIINDDTFVAVAMPETFVEEVTVLDDLTNDCKPDSNFKPNLGDTVAVYKDGTYVRGVVINNINGKYRCALIDYGITMSVPQVCPLPDKYLTIPEFACVCKANSATIQEISKGSEHPMAIETPSRIKVTIQGKVLELTACRWDPFETDRLAVTNNKPATNMQNNGVSAATVNKPIVGIPTTSKETKPNTPKKIISKPPRPTVIETIAKSGFFDCTQIINDDTFVGVAMPETFVEEVSILDDLTNDCKPDPTFKPNLGDTVAVYRDGAYVRGIVITNLNKEYTCALIDYGLTITVTEVRPLPDKYLTIPEFACLCKANSATIQEISKGSEHLMVIEKPSQIKVTINNSGKVVELTACRWDPFETSPSAPKKSQPVANIPEKAPEKEETLYKSSLKPYQLKPTDIVIIISEIEGSLIVRTRQCIDTLTEINEELKNYRGKPIQKPEINQLVICPFTDDGLYRGTVLSVNGPNAMIEYSDYGNCDTVPIKELKAISKILASFPTTCVKISLKGFVTSKFSVKALSYLEECAERREKFNIEVAGSDPVYDLLFRDKKSSLSEKLMAFDKPLKKPEVLPSPQKSEVQPSHQPATISPAVKPKSAPAKTSATLPITIEDIPRCKLNVGGDNTVMCMFAGDTAIGTVSFCIANPETIEAKMTQLTQKISENVEREHSPYKPKLLEVCLAKYEDEWYRAVYIKEMEDAYGMFYIDYGNTSTITPKDIRKMSKELGEFQCLSALCILQGVKQGDEPIKEPLLSKLLAAIAENEIYNIHVIEEIDNCYVVTIPSLYNQWKKEGLLS